MGPDTFNGCSVVVFPGARRKQQGPKYRFCLLQGFALGHESTGVDGKFMREELGSNVYDTQKNNVYLGYIKDWEP